MNGTLFFAADDGDDGVELWKSDGTAAGTVLVKDINPGSGDSLPSYLTNVNGTLFFAANDGTHGAELWKSDGTAAGTVLVKDINPGGALLQSLNHRISRVSGGHLFFTADDGVHGRELWDPAGGAAAAAVVAAPTPRGASRFGDKLWAGAATLPSAVAMLSRPQQHRYRSACRGFTSSAPVRAGKTRPTEILDRVLPAVAG